MILLIIKLIRQVAFSLYMAKDIISKHHYSKDASIHKVPKGLAFVFDIISKLFFSLSRVSGLPINCDVLKTLLSDTMQISHNDHGEVNLLNFISSGNNKLFLSFDVVFLHILI